MYVHTQDVRTHTHTRTYEHVHTRLHMYVHTQDVRTILVYRNSLFITFYTCNLSFDYFTVKYSVPQIPLKMKWRWSTHSTFSLHLSKTKLYIPGDRSWCRLYVFRPPDRNTVVHLRRLSSVPATNDRTFAKQSLKQKRTNKWVSGVPSCTQTEVRRKPSGQKGPRTKD